MLIHALSEYYDVLSKKGKLINDAYTKVGINYLICLSEEGKIIDIIDNHYEDTSGKKPKLLPKEEILPNIKQFSGIRSKYIEYRPTYIFGLNYDKKQDIYTTVDDKNKARKSHEDFIKTNSKFIEGIDTPVVNAYRKFIQDFSPEEELENQFLQAIKKDYQTANLGFCLHDISNLLHKDEKVLERWEEEFEEMSEISNENNACCAISGETSEIARIHDKIKGFNAMGSVLIGVKESAMCSYGKEQGYNACVSTEIMNKYTKALNYLLASRKHRSRLDDITVVHFAISGEEIYDDIFNMLFDLNVDEKMDDNQTSDAISKIMQDARNAMINEEMLNISGKIDEGIDFYVIGFKPNSSRIALKFIHRQKFGKVLENIARHQLDFLCEEDQKAVSIWQIQKELKSPVSKNSNVDPALATKLMHSILYGYDYPSFLLGTIIRRIKLDSDNDKSKFIKINKTRISIIKACINRSLRISNKEEEITMALDLENNNEAYLCGRLFAVLEDLQNDASGGGLNKTIKDAYFASACSKPSIIFPKLLKLATYHVPKAKGGSYREYEMREIISKLNGEFPDTLALKEQGKFVIGYYQQSQNKYIKKTKEEE